MPVLVGNDIYSTYSFQKEEDFENLVVKLSDHIFGEQTIYVDIKKQIRGNNIVTIPDGYVIDMTIPNDPKLFVIENEIVSHDPFRHIGIQMLKFVTSFEDDKTSIRNFIMKNINEDENKLQRLKDGCSNSNSRNIDNYLDEAVYSDFKGIVIIDEAKSELHRVLEKINANISVLELKTFISTDENFVYHFDSLYEDSEDIKIYQGGERNENIKKNRERKLKKKAECDTIIVPARKEGFERQFIGNSQWYAIRIGAAMKNRIKYIAAYQVAPISSVTHIVEIKEIKHYEDTGKYIVTFKGNAEEIEHVPVEDGNYAPQSPVYVKREDLLNANFLEDALYD